MRVSFVLRSAEVHCNGKCNYATTTIGTNVATWRVQHTYIQDPLVILSVSHRRLRACVCVCVIPVTLGNDDNKKPSTPWSSRAVPQPSTDLALSRLASEFERDPAHSIQYGRRLVISTIKWAEYPSTIGFLRRTLAKYVTPAFGPEGHFP